MSNCTATPEEAASGPKGKLFSQCYDALLKNCLDTPRSCDGSAWKELKGKPTRFRVSRATLAGHKNLARFKVSCVFPAPPRVLAKLAFVPEKRLEWDSASDSLDILKSYSPAMDLTRLVTRKVAIVKRREFIDYQWRVRGADGSYVCLWKSLSAQDCHDESLIGELCKAPKDRTRGENFEGSGWVFAPGPEKGTTQFHGVLTADLKGKLPKPLINKLTPTVLRKLCADVLAVVSGDTSAAEEVELGDDLEGEETLEGEAGERERKQEDTQTTAPIDGAGNNNTKQEHKQGETSPARQSQSAAAGSNAARN